MSKFNVPTIIIGFIIYAGLTVAPVPQSPASVYTECHGLSTSSRFRDMVSKLSMKGQQIPIVEKEAIWGKNGKVNFPKLLAAIKRFFDEAAAPRQVLSDIASSANQAKKLWTHTEIENASNFAKTHAVLLAMKEECGDTTTFVVQVGAVKCETVLHEFLSCVHKIRGLKKQTDTKRQNWSALQTEFAKSLLAICKRVVPEAANYSLLKKHEKLGGKAESIEAFINILEQKCGINDDNSTVEDVLNEGLKCAIKVHQFQQQILAVEKGGDKKLTYAQKWTELDLKFVAALKQIWEPKEVEMEISQDAGDQDADANASTDYKKHARLDADLEAPTRMDADYMTPAQLYKKCNDLSISDLFEQMLVKLEYQIPLRYYNWGINGADKYYIFVLTKITNVMNEIEEHKGVLGKKGNNEHAKTFLHGTHANFIQKLDAKLIHSDKTAKDVLKETLDCAHKIRQLKPEEKTEGQNWDLVEKIFKDNLGTICKIVDSKGGWMWIGSRK